MKSNSRRNAKPKRTILARKLGAATFFASLVAACGSRTGLLLSGEGLTDETSDTGAPDAKVHDAFVTFEDGATGADGADTSTPPQIDASLPDVPVPNDCPDADATLVYVLGEDNSLFSFFPPTLEFKSIGNITCPSTSSPFSMAVDRKGKAYSIFTDGNLFEVSTATAACTAAAGYVPGQQDFTTFGMGFSGDNTSETLFVVQEAVNATGASKGLASIDTTTFDLSFVGGFSTELDACELTGTGDGRLFAFCVSSDPTIQGSRIVQIDPKTANVIGQNSLKVGNNGDAFAFAFWGNSFWIFTSPGGESQVTQYDLDTLTETNVTTAPATIVGAGVSTCAPR